MPVSAQFNRKYELHIGVPAGTTTTDGDKTTSVPGAGQGILIKDLQVKFTINKTEDSNADTANIEVFNLSSESKKKITKDSVVILKVGYEGQGLSTIFTGSVSSFSTKKSGADSVTFLDCADGYTPFRETTLNKTFEKGVNVEKIIRYCATRAGIPIGALLNTGKSNGQGLSFVYSRGYAVSKSFQEEMESITKAHRLLFNVQSGYLIVRPENTDNLEPVVNININTGLIGSPSHSSQTKNSKEEKQSGVSFECLMNPLMVVGRRALLESEEYKRVDLRITKVRHSGDYRGSIWTTSVESKII